MHCDRGRVLVGESAANVTLEKGDRKAYRRSGCESFDMSGEGSVQNGHDHGDSMRMKKRKEGRLGGGKNKSLDRYLARLPLKPSCPCPSSPLLPWISGGDRRSWGTSARALSSSLSQDLPNAASLPARDSSIVD